MAASRVEGKVIKIASFRLSAFITVCAVSGAVFGAALVMIPPADARKIVGHTADGEPLCMATSDGAGQPYTDGTAPPSTGCRLMYIRGIRHFYYVRPSYTPPLY